MTKSLYIIKLGGSVITDKGADGFVVRTELIRAIAVQIARGFDPDRHQLLIVHGGGSASHAIAKEHALKAGTHGDAAKEAAGRAIQKNIHYLQDTLVAALQKAGCTAHAFRSEDLYINTKGALTKTYDTALLDVLAVGAVPVVSGAVIPDAAWGHSILSGDTLVAHYAQILTPRTIALASDVDGIFTANPHTDPDARFLSSVSLHDVISGTATHAIGDAHTTDITGGMGGKLRAFAPLLDMPHKTQHLFIFNGTQPENFAKVFTKQDLTKTNLVF